MWDLIMSETKEYYLLFNVWQQRYHKGVTNRVRNTSVQADTEYHGRKRGPNINLE